MGLGPKPGPFFFNHTLLEHGRHQTSSIQNISTQTPGLQKGTVPQGILRETE